jgi:hypothetical protein
VRIYIYIKRFQRTRLTLNKFLEVILQCDLIFKRQVINNYNNNTKIIVIINNNKYRLADSIDFPVMNV